MDLVINLEIMLFLETKIVATFHVNSYIPNRIKATEKTYKIWG